MDNSALSTDDATNRTERQFGADTFELRLEDLKAGPEIRVQGEDGEHARLLADLSAPLPPILVHRTTMQVLDGMHRVSAARIRGDDVIRARYFDGDERQAYVAAVRANIEHGKPLSLADREAAASRVIELHPEWSDRLIADICALSARKVALVRAQASEDLPPLDGRVGRDGRLRPADPIGTRERIRDAVTKEPDASLRHIAQETGASVATVRDVRRRMTQGESVVPASLSGRRPGQTERPGEQREDTAAQSAPEAHPNGYANGSMDAPEVMEERPSMTDGPSAGPPVEARSRHKSFAAWFDALAVRPEEIATYALLVPPERSRLIAAEARSRAAFWDQFASTLDRRAVDPDTATI